MKKLLFLLPIFVLLQLCLYAQNVGIGTATPAVSAQLDVSSTTKGFLPPRMTYAERNAIANPGAGLIIYNTTTNKPNYFNGIIWKNFDETSAANLLAIGDTYQGGKIAYILQSGDPGFIFGQTHGLIAATSDQSTGTEWGCFGTLISGANGTAFGTGNQNTIDIMAGCATAGIAARLCGDLVLGGYSDWYLPSQDELYELYINRGPVGLNYNYYWSSSESGSSIAWVQNVFNGTQSSSSKSSTYYVRAVRAF
jgi:hypothetical protein